MTLEFNRGEAVSFLQEYLTHNKARGMVSEYSLETHLQTYATPLATKFLPGGWVISPKTGMPPRLRVVAIVLPQLFENDAELHAEIEAKQTDRGFQALATFLSQSAIGVIVAGAVTGMSGGLGGLTWRNYSYRNERLELNTGDEPYTKWPGNRGVARRASGPGWDADVIARYAELKSEQLTGLTLRQAYNITYLKQRLKKPFDDPYDVDAFIVSFRQAVMPVEIKEKSRTPNGDFGLDAGRILMMLRMCLATDSNALYIIREVDTGTGRGLIGWRCITLSNLIMGCSWNLQQGGRGMGGGATQTVMMPGSLFEAFTEKNFSEEWLAGNSSLQDSVRAKAQEITVSLESYL
jgi:hypothetical protein